MLKERCRQFRYTEQHQGWDYQNADLKKINFQIAAVLSLLAMAVVEAGCGGYGGHYGGHGGYGHHGYYGKRAADYGYNGHAYGLNTDHNMRRYEDQNYGSFGQYGLHSKQVDDYCSDKYCVDYPH